jgi:putative heme-binding domain-containing protein
LELLSACLESVEHELEREWTFAGHLAPFAADARAVLEGSLADAELDRRAALVLLGREPQHLERDVELLAGVLTGGGDAGLRRAALGALARIEGPLPARAVLDALDGLGPTLKEAALDALLSRAEWAELVLADLEEHPARRAVLDAARRQLLLRHPAPAVRERAARVLGAPARGDVDELLARYAGLGTLEASPRRGAAVFERACAQCHQLEGVGKPIGPDLAAVTDRSNRALLVAILDPNRAINAQYVSYRVHTRDGRDLDGLVLEESASHVTLRTLTEDVRLLRADIEALEDTGLSLMPEGLESELPPQAMADLCAYLREIGEAPKSFAGNAPALVKPGEDGTLVLAATACRIHGPSLVFEEPFRNLGYWSSADDRAVWDVELPAAAELAIELEYACDDGVAGNAFVLASDLGELRGTVAGTGGWPSYRTVALGCLALPAGRSRVTFRSDGPIRGALLDLRALRGRPR